MSCKLLLITGQVINVSDKTSTQMVAALDASKKVTVTTDSFPGAVKATLADGAVVAVLVPAA